ncbi:spore cortex biosynthesis protein YabQ [Sporolactobacillus sp. THM7-7]|nr:spore cortex biosynthesis protein YabQ [Sporolactobacillus sp. THM7-7]
MTLHEQFVSLALMGGMGLWIGASFTVYQRFVHPRKGLRWILLITDSLFWIVQALLVFTFLFPVNEGQLRLYLFLAAALGFSLYKALFETPFLIVLNRMIAFIVFTWRTLAKTVYLLLIYPLYSLLKLVYILCKMTVSILVKCLIFPLKIGRGLLRAVLPEKWQIGIDKRIPQIRQMVVRWTSIVMRRK